MQGIIQFCLHLRKIASLSAIKIQDNILSIFLIAMILLLIVNVLIRYAFPAMPGSIVDGGVKICLTWMAFLGIGILAENKRGHLSAEFFIERLPKKAAKAVEIMSNIVILIVTGILSFMAFRLTCSSWGESYQYLSIPSGLLPLSLLLGGVLMIIYVIIRLIKLFKIHIEKKS